MEVNPKKSSDKSDQRYFENKLHLIDVDSAIGLWKDGTEWWTVLFWKQNQREPIKRFSSDANIQAGLVFWRKIGFQSPTRYSNNWNIFRLYGVRMRESEGALISYHYYFYYFHYFHLSYSSFLIWFLANLSWAWSPIRVCLHHQGTVRSGNILKLTSLAIFHTSKFLSVDLGLGFGRWHRRKQSSCFLSLLFWSTMDEQYDDDI